MSTVTLPKIKKVYEEIKRTQRPITTAYIEQGIVIKRITANNPNGALMRCFSNMHLNSYGASIAHVYSTETGRLFAEVIRKKNNEVLVTTKVDPNQFDDPLRRDPTRSIAAFI